MKPGTFVYNDLTVSQITSRKVTAYGCDISAGSVLVQVYFSLLEEKKPFHSEEVWPPDTYFEVPADILDLVLEDPKKFLNAYAEIKNEQ
jgi:hypothetical protein